MKLSSQSFHDGGAIPGRCALGAMDAVTHIHLSLNRNPHLAWSEVSEGTQSFVLLCIDPDAPSEATDVNQEGKTVSKSLKRADFVHWVMVDIPATLREIAEASCSDGVTPHGKQQPEGPAGTRQGINSYTDWFAGDADMEGTWLGYDGPCPPWNDELAHRYRFELHALDLARCPVEAPFDVDAVRKAIDGHILESAELTGLYSLNPSVRFG